MVNWPEMKRKAGFRVAEKLKRVSVQCRTDVTVSEKKFDKVLWLLRARGEAVG